MTLKAQLHSIVGRIQRSYGIRPRQLGEWTERVSPSGLIPLMEALESYTQELERQTPSSTIVSVPVGATVLSVPVQITPEQIVTEIARWRKRLDWYRAMVETPETTFDDPNAVLWTVVAPLLLGHYYGPEGDEGIRPPEGWPSEDALLPPIKGAAPDLRTPFILMSWATEDRTLKLPTFVDALKEAANEAPTEIARVMAELILKGIEGMLAGLDAPKFIKPWHVVAGAGAVGALVWFMKK
jgi:hypothetical protein